MGQFYLHNKKYSPLDIFKNLPWTKPCTNCSYFYLPPNKDLYKIEVKCLGFVTRPDQAHIPGLHLTIYWTWAGRTGIMWFVVSGIWEELSKWAKQIAQCLTHSIESSSSTWGWHLCQKPKGRWTKDKTDWRYRDGTYVPRKLSLSVNLLLCSTWKYKRAPMIKMKQQVSPYHWVNGKGWEGGSSSCKSFPASFWSSLSFLSWPHSSRVTALTFPNNSSAGLILITLPKGCTEVWYPVTSSTPIPSPHALEPHCHLLQSSGQI